MTGRRFGVCAVSAALLCGGAADAEEIAPYKLTGIEGYATLDYVSDEQAVDQQGTGRSRQAQSGWRSELFAMTHSYVYHPNLLTLDVGGGPILHGESFVGDSGTTRARGLLYNFTARGTFLRDKPYTGDLFFSHLNPTVSIAPGEVLTQESTRYGFDFSLLAPVTPVPLQFGFVRSQLQGRGASRLIDDRIDQFNLTASRSFDALGSSQLRYQASRQASRSGSLDLPLKSSNASSQGLTVDTRLQFGDRRQYDVANVFSLDTQKYALDTGSVPALEDLRFMLDGRARHSDEFNTFGFYNYGRNRQGVLDTVSQAASAGLSYWPTKGAEAGLGVHADSSSARQQYQSRSQGVDGNLRYERELLLGAAQAGYAIRVDRHEQIAASPQTSVIGEFQTLSGTGYVTLGHPYVVAGSIAVFNASRSQAFVEGVDYALLVVGTDTRIQRLVGGRILDGEQVLLDYAYDTGGTYTYRQIDQTFNLGWNLGRYVGVYFRRLESAPRLVSGLPAFPLNEVRADTVGVRADVPWNPGIATTMGAGIEREVRRETVSPYRRYSAEVYAQSDEPVFDLGFLRAAMRRSRIDYDNAWQDSDLHGQELRYWSRQWFGIDLTAGIAAERDDAGALPRRRREASIGARWQERRLTLSGTFQHVRESQGGVERLRTTLQFQARRELW